VSEECQHLYSYRAGHEQTTGLTPGPGRKEEGPESLWSFFRSFVREGRLLHVVRLDQIDGDLGLAALIAPGKTASAGTVPTGASSPAATVASSSAGNALGKREVVTDMTRLLASPLSADRTARPALLPTPVPRVAS
jgi:hypothetical protein